MQSDNQTTIEDLARMIQKGFEETITKKEISDKFNDLIASVATKDDIKELKQEVIELRKSVDSLTRAIDKLSKVVDDLRIEYASLMNQTNRHERWFQIIAEKVGVKLEY